MFSTPSPEKFLTRGEGGGRDRRGKGSEEARSEGGGSATPGGQTGEGKREDQRRALRSIFDPRRVFAENGYG